MITIEVFSGSTKRRSAMSYCGAIGIYCMARPLGDKTSLPVLVRHQEP